jgi:TonB-linked SusC/RagA family outer membrane protein
MNKVYKVILFCLLFTGLCYYSNAQPRQVTGVVTDESGQPLPGVSIIVKGTSTGASSDSDGKFAITIDTENAVLVLSFLGYLTQELPVNNQSTIMFAMTPNIQSLAEIVIVGYGEQKARDLIGAVSRVNSTELQDLPVGQFTQRIQGKLSGVQVSQTTGRPGEGMRMRVRGAFSLGAGNTPLFVVDGFPITGDVVNINPDEIESISLLKDAASAALYGSRAANGVLLITTKRAKEGPTRIDFNYNYGVQTVTNKSKLKMLNGEEFAQFMKEVYEDRGLTVPAEYSNPSVYGEGTDWFEELIRTAPIQTATLSVMGGGNKSKTAVTAGYFKQDGVLHNSGYERFSLRANNEFSLGKVTLGLNVAPTYQINNNMPATDGGGFGSGGGVIIQALLASPIVPAYNSDGTRPTTVASTNLLPVSNPYRSLTERKSKTQSLRTLANTFIQVNIFDGLSYKLRGDIDFETGNNYYFNGANVGGINTPPPQVISGGYSSFQQYSWQTENQLAYNKTFNDHKVDAIVAYTAQKFREENVQASSFPQGTTTNPFPNEDIPWISAATSRTGNAGTSGWSLLSYLGRVNYSFKDRYLFSVAYRRDGSSRFGPLNRWGNFPSVSAGWVVSDESFFQNLPVSTLSFLKLRANYGVTGNFNIGNYTYLTTLAGSNYVFNNTLAAGSALGTFGNPELGWERTRQTDIGLDLGLFNDRVFIELDYYKKNTDGLLYDVNVPNGSGFTQIKTNLGEFKFWGFETTISTKNTTGEIKWNTDFNLTIPRNEVVKLGITNAPVQAGVSNAVRAEVGQPIGMFYGYIKEGVYINQSDYDNSAKPVAGLGGATGSGPGSVKYRDFNNDGRITAEDMTFIGNPNPKFLLGMTNTVMYKGIDVSVVFNGSYGNDVFRNIDVYTMNLDAVFNVRDIAKDRWRSESNPGNGFVASTNPAHSPLDRSSSSQLVHDASFLRVQNITVGYTPTLKTKTIRKARAYLSVQNALLFTKYPGNPEVSLGGLGGLANYGVDYSSYPVPRIVTMGVNLSF